MTPKPRRTLRWLLPAALVASTVAPAVSQAAPRASTAALVVEVLSNRADLVSGGDAFAAVRLPAGVDPDTVRVRVGSRDVTSAFGVRGDGAFSGLLTNLRVGENRVTARAPGVRGAELSITNHPIGGPVFSGPQLQPWFCFTEDSGLGAALDAQCNAKTVYAFVYRSAVTGRFETYDPAAPPAAGLIATTTTDHGVTVPYIVRTERGTLNRTVYDIAVLFDPAKPWTAVAPQKQWNKKFYYTFGGGCANRYRQTANSSAVLDHIALSRGFAVATAGLNVLANNCNEVLSGETVMMVKERLVDGYGGPLRYTMATGCSGGSLQQYNIAASYPGLLDGIQPSCTFADITTTVKEVHDCKILLRYFQVTSPHLWQVESQRAAVLGHLSTSSCSSHQALNLDRSEGDPTYCNTGRSVYTSPTETVTLVDEEDWAYDPQTNPKGARCGIWDFTRNVWGTRAADGFANRPWNNLAIQYGLVALQSGLITAEQFVDLNEKVGGLDIDYRFQSKRTAPDPGSVATAYRASRVTTGHGLAQAAIVDTGGWEDVELHTTVRAWSVKERIKKANGTAANHVILRQTFSGEDTFRLLDQWLSNVERDRSARTRAQKIIANRPSAAVDSCVVGGKQFTDPSFCRNTQTWQHYGNPRMAAGEGLADDVMQCQTRPLDRADYPVAFPDAQWQRLQAVFPQGVCNWTLPSVGEQEPILWSTYADRPGGQALGAAPRSVPLS